MDLGSTKVDPLPSVQKDACAKASGVKPAIPKKPILLNTENPTKNGTSHVKDLVKKLQERESPNRIAKNLNIPKMGAKLSKPFSLFAKEEVKAEAEAEASNKTLEDLQAIDEDIEKLRNQIEERDKIISALREAAEAKDKKLENFMMEYSKLQSSGKLDLDPSSEPIRANSSSPTSPPLCDGELCWTDSFVNKNYHEPVYAQLLNDHTALQKVYNELKIKLEAKGKEFERLEAETKAAESGIKMENQDNAINLIMAEQIRMLKEREAQLIAEAEELREQNDLMEFRILELEECRKEFLAKEVIHEEKHRPEKLMWSDRDVEDISDSGVMSLPTSEDLNSDSELSEGVRNYSPLGPVTNLSLLPSENFYSEPSISEVKSKKSLKSFECLQESGIFEEVESPSSNSTELPLKQSRGCQTETILDKTLLDLIDSSCDLLLTKNRSYFEQKYSDDLSTEISKLSVIQKRIQQKAKTPPSQGPHTVFTCPHSHSVLFYEERLGQLEDKLKIYESSGDTKDILLAKRLQKEIELACRVKELTEKVATLEVNNRKLEEEKCEFEEAENDTRFQCQRLEIRLQELIEKNADLEVELDRQKVKMSEERRKDKKKGSLENLISRYEQKTFELEEKEEEARQRLNMIEAAMPVIVAWNIFRVSQNPEFKNLLGNTNGKEFNKVEKTNTTKNQFEVGVVFKKLEELLADQKKLRKEYEKVEETAADREKVLKSKIEELELKAAKDREMLEEMTNALKVLKSEEKCQVDPVNVIRPEEIDLFEELKIMVANETHLRAEIDRLQKEGQTYMESLEQCDEIWYGMEAEYKRRLEEAEENSQELQKRISQLEVNQLELEKALENRLKQELPPPKSDVQSKFSELLEENEMLKVELNQKIDKKFDEQKTFLEKQNDLLKEELKKLKLEFLREERKCVSIVKDLERAKEEAAKEKEVAQALRLEKEMAHKKAQFTEANLRHRVSKLTDELKTSNNEISSLNVTVAELREEVETLEAKIGKLVETIQESETLQDDEPVASQNETPQIVVPTEDERRQLVSYDFKRPSDEVVDNRIVINKEKELPITQVLIPRIFEYEYKYLVCFSAISIREEVKFLHSPLLSSQVQVKYAKFPPTMLLWVWNKQNEDKQDREDEIFQLSLKNTELLQLLEKMEEESKSKEKELEELQKLAHEIRKEQETLERQTKFLLERAPFDTFEEIPLDEGNSKKTMEMTSAEEPEEYFEQTYDEKEERHENLVKTESLDFLQNPIVVKTSEEMESSVNESNTLLDMSANRKADNSSARQSLFNEINQKGDSREYEDMMDQLAPQSSAVLKKDPDFQDDEFFVKTANTDSKRFKEKRSRSSTPNHLGRSSSASSSIHSSLAYSKQFGPKTQGTENAFSYVAPIRTLRKVDDDVIFIKWDISHKPDNVTGFEILVNGTPNQMVRCSTRNKALLRQLNLNQKILIQVFAISEHGRSIRCSHVTYPDEHYIYRTGSE